jgi:hypothetical protein
MISGGLINSITRVNRSTGLEVVLHPDGGITLNYVGIIKQGGLICVEKAERFYAVADFAKVVDKKYPVYISFDGKGVLHRENSGTKTGYEIGDYNGRSTEPDVVEQTILLNDGSEIKSYTRMDRIAELSDALMAHGYYVFQIMLGPFACGVIAETDNPEATITTPRYELQYAGGVLTSFSKRGDSFAQSSFVVEGKEINLDFLIAFANAVCHFAGMADSGIGYPPLKIREEEFRYKNLIEKLRLPFLLCCFMVLVINYLIYERYRASNVQMRNELARDTSVIEEYEKLASLFEQKEKYLVSSGFRERTLISYYSDRIAGTIPDGLKITRMTFAPEEKKSSGSSVVSYQNGIIMIFGVTESGIALNGWIQALKKFSWVAEVRMLGYTNTGDDLADFNIEIKMSEK